MNSREAAREQALGRGGVESRGIAQPLAALWCLEPLPRLVAGASYPPPRRPTEVVLGSGPWLDTSAGIAVQLPRATQGPEAALACLEGWASMILSEGYGPRPSVAPSLALKLYYGARPFIPRSAQLWLRRRHARGREERAFLGWPHDGLYVALAEAYLALRILEGGPLSVRQFWPSPHEAAVVLTHDVEGSDGQGSCRKLAALERMNGVRSCFNFVAERYAVDRSLMAELQDAGFEIGLHGIKHDGKKFSSRSIFEQRLGALRQYRDAWHVTGFRSPATHRRWEWMGELPFEWDSSFPDTDPYEPMPGGCGSPWPFSIGSVLELPITLPQDHTLWEILRRDALKTWRRKAEWLRSVRGLINIVVHPDYLTTTARWIEYERFVAYVREGTTFWVTTPSGVNTWWRAPARAEARLLNRGARHRLSLGASATE